MKKSYKAVGLAALATSLLVGGPGGPVDSAFAEPSRQELTDEIQELRKLVQELNTRLSVAERKLEEADKRDEKIADVEDMVDELDERVAVNERHTAIDRLSFNVDLRTELTSLHYKDARVLPEWSQTMLSLWAMDDLLNPAKTGFNTTFATKYNSLLAAMMPAMQGLGFVNGLGVIQNNSLGVPHFSTKFGAADLAKYQQMFNGITPETQDIDNDAIWTTRARFDMRADPDPHLTFAGRLTANKVWADSTGVKWYSGDMSSVTMDGNVSQKGSDSAIRLERGYVTYRDDWDDVHWHFSLGRRPAVDGAPWEVSTHSVVGGSPMAHAINWQFDGASLGFDLSKVSGVTGANLKFCYGMGFESGIGAGNSYSMDYSSDVDDVNFLGYIARFYDDGTTKVVNMYAHAFDVTDGFTGLVAMPFSISAVDADNDDIYDTYFLDANKGGYVSRMEAFTNIGSMDIVTLLLQSKYRGVDWFVDLAMNHTRSSGISQNPMMQFMGTDGLLNSNGQQDSHTGYSVWAGIKTPVPWSTGAALGFEFNWGSRYWLGFNGAEDTLGGSKLAVRGTVYELYYHHPILKQLLLSMGAQYWDYKYTGSGNPMGEPKRIEEATALDTVMPVADELWSYYINLNYRW